MSVCSPSVLACVEEVLRHKILRTSPVQACNLAVCRELRCPMHRGTGGSGCMLAACTSSKVSRQTEKYLLHDFQVHRQVHQVT